VKVYSPNRVSSTFIPWSGHGQGMESYITASIIYIYIYIYKSMDRQSQSVDVCITRPASSCECRLVRDTSVVGAGPHGHLSAASLTVTYR